jgi:hypothetical protein
MSMLQGIAIVLAVVGLWLLYVYVRVNRRVRRPDEAPISTMDRAEVVAAFDEARKVVISRMRHPLGSVTQAGSEAALERAVACADRLDELNGKQHGQANRFKIRRELIRRFKEDADNWLGAEAASYPIFAEQERGGTVPERIGALLR